MTVGWFSDAFSKIGANILQGPHQSAQKSINVRPSALMVDSKFVSLSATVAIVVPELSIYLLWVVQAFEQPDLFPQGQ